MEAEVFRMSAELQLVTEQTRVRETDTPSILGLMFTYNNLKIENINYGNPLGINIHVMPSFSS